MPNEIQYLTREQAVAEHAAASGEFAVIENVAYAFPRHELVPLAPKQERLEAGIACALMDMDGTLTTTENLCLDALETMIRRMTGHAHDPHWTIDAERDHPQLIGNSVTKHVEYLIRTYGQDIHPPSLKDGYIRALAYGLAHAPEAQRRRELRENADAIGARALLDSQDLARLGELQEAAPGEADLLAARLCAGLGGALRLDTEANRLRAGIDIYYQRYHSLMANLAGHGTGPPLIQPMPGVGVLLALLKGWLGQDAALCHSFLAQCLPVEMAEAAGKTGATLSRLGAALQNTPARTALVTSSSAWETQQILTEVFRQLREETAAWGLPARLKEQVVDGFADHRSFFDVIVTASDTSEMRLKPHRDLYAIALQRLNLSEHARRQTIGFEDSAVGCLALRAAGIGLACALPWSESLGQDYSAASAVCPGGLPEVLMLRNLFLPTAAH